MAWDEKWESIFQNKIWGKYPHDILVGFVAKNFYKVTDRKKIKILEIGCGSGNNLWFLAREGFSAYGLDGSPTAIKQSEDYLKENNVSADLQIGDAVNLSYEDNFFDLVIDFGCIGCNKEKEAKQILAEALRVLKPNGLYFNETVGEECDMGTYENREGKTYFEFSEGPFTDLGIIRQVDRDDIHNLYGKYLKIESIDQIKSTVNNGQYNIHKYIIIGKK